MTSADHHDLHGHLTAVALVDEHASLDDGWLLAWCVAPFGDRWPWLIAPTVFDDVERAQVIHGCGCPTCAPHEQPGPLPDRHRLGLQAVPIRCGAPRKDGQPCRAEVAAGTRCHWHRLRLVAGDA